MIRCKFDDILRNCTNSGERVYGEHECNEGTACTVNRASHTSVTLTHACCLQREAEWKV